MFKNLFEFEGEFQILKFLQGKKLSTLECSEWREYSKDSKKPGAVLGTKVTLVFLEDKTPYSPGKNGQPVSNRYAQMVVKVKKKDLAIPVDTIVELVNPVARIYGDYRNELSVTADDIRPVTATATGKSQ